MKNDDKYHLRTLREIDKHGRETSIRIIKDLDAMLRDYGLVSPKEDQEDKKEKCKLIPFPK